MNSRLPPMLRMATCTACVAPSCFSTCCSVARMTSNAWLAASSVMLMASPLLAAGREPRFRLVIGALGVVGALLRDGAVQVVAVGAGIIEDADQGVRELDLRHLPVWQLVVHEVLALPLHRLGNFRVDQAEQFA